MVINIGEGGWAGATSTVFAQMRGYWEALRDEGSLPRRADLDPRGLKNSLHQTMIAERIAPGLARVRLAGATYTDLMGMELRGMPLSALFDPMARKALETVLEEVFTGNTAITLLLEAERGLGRPALTAQLMLLPMLGEHGLVDLALGGMAIRGSAGRTPRRFHILNIRREALTADANPSEKAKPFTFAEPQPAYAQAAPLPQAPYLRVVK
jgi:hypothetical protein